MVNHRFVILFFTVTFLCAARSFDETDFSYENEDSFLETIKRFLKKKTTTEKPSSGAISALITTTPSNSGGLPTRKVSILPGRTRSTVGPTKDACGSASKCQNGGTCRTLSSGQYYCFCPQDYYGKNCEKKFITTGSDNNDRKAKDHCASNPCRNNGECIGLRTTFYCRCKSPFYGVSCDKKIGKREAIIIDESNSSEQDNEFEEVLDETED